MTITGPSTTAGASAPAPLASPEDALLPLLPLTSRLALAYAPRDLREPTLALLALDMRLAGLLRHSREPMLAQIRFAWWRETLRQDASAWPVGEPLLAVLRSWRGVHGGLEPLVDGWEALTGPAPLAPEALSQMADGRAQAFVALAGLAGREDEAPHARALGRGWALADLAMRLSHPAEREAVRAMLAAERSPKGRTSRPLRPLLVLHGLARRRLAKGADAGATSPLAVLKALRLGLLGF